MRASVAAFIAVFAVASSTLPAFAANVTVPAGTQVQVRVVHSISSGSATTDQRFAFEAAEPVIINNHVVIAKGALGSGRIINVSKAQGKSAGKMTLAFTSIHAVDGGTVSLTEDSRVRGNSEKGKASTATIAATIALGPIGLFAHNMVKGKDVTVTPSQTFPAWVKANASVNVH
jgi:hypothetical protein